MEKLRKMNYMSRSKWENYRKGNINSIREKWAKKMGPDLFMDEEERYDFRNITDIPVMIADDGSIVCIPKRSESNNIACVGSKGSGKCLSGHTEIITKEGYKKIKDIEEGDRVVSMNKEYKTEFKSIVKKDKTRIEKKANIKLKSGEEISCSSDHKFPVLNRETLEIYKKKIEDIDKDKELLLKVDKIPIEERLEEYSGWNLTFDFGFLIGIYLAEGGYCVENRVGISNRDYSLKKYVEKIIKREGLSYTNKDRSIKIYNQDLLEFLLNNFKTGSADKKVPEWVFNSNADFIEGIISGYMNGDGVIYKKDSGGGGKVGYLTKSKDLAEGIQRLLLEIGINCRIKPKHKKYKGEKRKYWDGLILNVEDLEDKIILFIKSKDKAIKKKQDSTFYFIGYKGRNLGKKYFKENGIPFTKKNNTNTRRKSFFWKDIKGDQIRKVFCKVWDFLKNNSDKKFSVEEIRNKLGCPISEAITKLKNKDLLDIEEKKVEGKRKGKMNFYYIDGRYKLKDLSDEEKKIVNILKNEGANIGEIKEKTGFSYGKIYEYLRNKDYIKKKKKEQKHKRVRPIYSLKKDAKLDKEKEFYSNYLRNQIKKISKSDIFCSKIDNIEITESEENMYDIQVEDNHNFVLKNSIVSSNSLLLHRIADEVFWLWNENIFIHDLEEEVFEWVKPLNEDENSPGYEAVLREIDENPFPLPIVFIYPHTKTLDNIYSDMKGKYCFLQTTIPFLEVISNSDKYLFGGGKAKDENAAYYVRSIKDELLGCEVKSDVYDVIKRKYGGQKGLMNKILSRFDEFFQEEITDITNPEFPSMLEYNDVKAPPIILLMKLGVIPCIETSELFTKHYLGHIIGYHLEEVFKSKQKNGVLKNEGNIHVFFDELTHIADDKNQQDRSHQALVTIATRGRKKGVSLKYATQNYSRIPNKIINNTDYVFIFTHSSDKEIKDIKKDFNLGRFDVENITELVSRPDEVRFEVVAATNEYLVKYKRGKRWTTKGPVRGKVIPPMSEHMREEEWK